MMPTIRLKIGDYHPAGTPILTQFYGTFRLFEESSRIRFCWHLACKCSESVVHWRHPREFRRNRLVNPTRSRFFIRMRLELEPTFAAPHVMDEPASANNGVDSAEAKSALNQGIKAAQAGNRALARTSLLRATEIDPRSENAWLWLASISEYPEELLGFLNHVLEINPKNERALEWKSATNALLARTFVQRGIDAIQENQNDFAAECFQTALDYDERNAAAWMWMASLSDSNTVKVGLLEKALYIEPENPTALAALDAAKCSILKERLTEAKAAAVSGNNAEAIRILDALLVTNSDSVEAWTMRSHLAEGFDEKIRCFESILAIDPENVAAKAGRDSLLSIFGSVEDADAEQSSDYEGLNQNADATADEQTAKSPTEALEPSEAAEERPRLHLVAPVAQVEEEAEYVYEPMEYAAEPTGSLETEVADAVEAAGDSSDELTEQVVYDEVDAAESTYADPRAETVVFSYDQESEPEPEPIESEAVVSAPEIPMPSGEFPELGAPGTEPEVAEVPAETSELIAASPESVDCPFCGQANEPQDYSCSTCLAVLTLSDLELLLANQQADKLTLRQAVEEMERNRQVGETSSDDLVILGLGHLNLRNFQLGYSCLAEASRLDPNNVVLGGQVNSLLIRLEEIRLQEEAHLKMPKGKSILVVDDSATVRKLISGKLEKCGHDVVCASDGVEAMERLEHFIPDLILLDITMPRMDGYQVCKTIRSNNTTKDVPVVMISGKDGFFDKVRGRMAGTTGYITKPFGPETLMKAVEMYLSGEIPESDEV